MTWNYSYNPDFWPALITACFLLGLALYGALRRSLPGAIPFMIANLFAAAWAAGSAMEFSAVDLPTKIFWVRFEAVWQLPAATAMTSFILEYAWPGRWLTRRNLALLSIVPLAVLGMIVTDNLHHWMWRGFNMAGSVIPLLNAGSWVAIVYSFGLVILNLAVFVWLFLHSSQHRWPVAIMVTGHIGFRALFVLEKINLIPSDLPFDVVGLAFMASMYAFALFGFRIFDPLPLACQTAIEQLRDGMLVLDPQGRVAGLNPAAERILGTPPRQILGKLIGEILPRLPRPDLPLTGDALLLQPVEVTLGFGADTRCYELDSFPLNDFRRLPVGRLLILHDVTEQRQSQAQIMEQQRALAVLKEREQVARELHDELSQELAFINTQAQALADSLAAGQTAHAEARVQRLAEVAREAQIDVRAQISTLTFAIPPEEGFPGALQQVLDGFSRTFMIPVDLILNKNMSESCLEPTAEVQLLRITQEALTNIRKHAHARHARVSLKLKEEAVELSIEDDGVGFDPKEPQTDHHSFGLGIMAERAKEIGGSLQIISQDGRGTRVSISVPAAKKGAQSARTAG